MVKEARGHINVLVEKLLLQASNQVAFLCAKEPPVVLKKKKKKKLTNALETRCTKEI